MLMPATKTPWLEQWFLRYTHTYLKRSFHAIHLYGERPRIESDGRTPLLVCLNHSSWWDVLVGLFMATELFGWEYYTVMDARQLQRYRFFCRLGVIGVDRSSLAGVKEFLPYAETLLKGRQRALFLTPQGVMTSNYTRPIRFQPGVGRLAPLLGDFHLARVAMHYEFWDERLPEAFISVSPVERRTVCGADFDRRRFVHEQELALEAQLDALLAAVRTRDPAAFHPLLTGKGGISPTYDAIRRIGAALKGERFTPEHGEVLTPQWKNRR
jgi:1-acyl-sn-glycerol-3-phosphate acyltransferase